MNSLGSIKQDIDLFGNSYDLQCDLLIKEDTSHLDIKQEIECDSNKPMSDNINNVPCIMSAITDANIDNGSFQCSRCEKCFNEQISLEKHLIMHFGEESHRCTSCDSSFSQKGDLVRHQKTHTEDNPFQCSECGEFFALKGDLMNHLSAHTGDKLVKCSYCDIWFTQEKNLEQQQTTHTGEKPHQMIYCDKCLSENNHLLGNQKATEKKYKRYSLEEKEKIADLCEIYKAEYDKEVAENKKLPKHWDPKRKKFCELHVKAGYIARAIRELYPSLAKLHNEHPEFRRVLGVARRCLENRQNKRRSGELIGTGSKHKFRHREPGGGRKPKAVEVRQAAFDWFVDIRGSLKGSLPIKIFKEKCVELYDFWLSNQSKEIKAEDPLKFSNHWVKDWMREYNVSLLNPNKRFAISQEDRILKICEFLKNIMRVRYYFQFHFKKEPVIISGDQMPLHRNEIPKEKTVMQEFQAKYVKENLTLSRERATIYTQLSTESQYTMPTPEILFKGKDVGIESPFDMSVQFAYKGSYRLENMLKTVKTLKNRHHIHSEKDYALYILDDYSVHMQDKIRQYLLQQGYVLVIMGRGITGDIQINETHLHHQLKALYCEKESELMRQKLRAAPNRIPTPTRNEMIKMLLESWGTINIHTERALKNNFILNAFDGSEDNLVTNNLMALVGEEIMAFRRELLSSPPPQSIDELIKTLTTPQSVKSKGKIANNVPPDEGRELIDCEGDEIPMGEEDEVEEPLQLSCPALVDLLDSVNANNSYELATNTPDCINKADSEFLKDITDVLHKYMGKTSKLISPYYDQFHDTLTKAECSLDEHILSNISQSIELARYAHSKDPKNNMTEHQAAIEDTLLNLFSQNKQLS